MIKTLILDAIYIEKKKKKVNPDSQQTGTAKNAVLPAIT
jgi:hypothetical protein